MVSGFVESVIDDFDDDEAFDAEEVGDIFAGHCGPLGSVVEDGEEVGGGDRVGGVGVLDESVVDSLVDAGDDPRMLGFDCAGGGADDGEGFAFDSCVLSGVGCGSCSSVGLGHASECCAYDATWEVDEHGERREDREGEGCDLGAVGVGQC